MSTQPPPRTAVRWASGLNILAGLWLLLAPFALAYGSEAAGATWNDITIGATIAVLAATRVAAPLQFQSISWISFVLGSWLVMAPFVVGYSETAAAVSNDIMTGIVVLSLAVWSAAATQAGTARARGEALRRGNQ